MKGYLGDPQLTQEYIYPDPFSDEHAMRFFTGLGISFDFGVTASLSSSGA